MGRFPSLYSLFQTKENIESFGVQTKLGDQRYLAAWDFSAQLCAIEHPGVAPCFFPSDFSSVPGRRSAQDISTLVDRCPSLIFYEEYHKKTLVSMASPLLDADPPPSPPDSSNLQVARERAYCQISSWRACVEDLEADAPGPQPTQDASQAGPVNPKIEEIDTDNSSPNSATKPMASTSVKTMSIPAHKLSVTWMDAIPSMSQKATGVHALKGARLRDVWSAVPESTSQYVKETVHHNLGCLRRSILRRYMGRVGELIIDNSPWTHAEDTFVTRLTFEIRNLQTEISQFLQSWDNSA